MPPMATEVVPNQPTVRGCGRGGGFSPREGGEVEFIFEFNAVMMWGWD